MDNVCFCLNGCFNHHNLVNCYWFCHFHISSWFLLFTAYVFILTGGSLTKLAYYSTVQHKVAKVRSFDHSTKVRL